MVKISKRNQLTYVPDFQDNIFGMKLHYFGTLFHKWHILILKILVISSFLSNFWHIQSSFFKINSHFPHGLFWRLELHWPLISQVKLDWTSPLHQSVCRLEARIYLQIGRTFGEGPFIEYVPVFTLSGFKITINSFVILEMLELKEFTIERCVQLPSSLATTKYQ